MAWDYPLRTPYHPPQPPFVSKRYKKKKHIKKEKQQGVPDRISISVFWHTQRGVDALWVTGLAWWLKSLSRIEMSLALLALETFGVRMP